MITSRILSGIAIALGFALVASSVTLYMTKRDLKVAEGSLENAEAAIRVQKREAQAKLDQLTVEVNDANRKLAEALAAQEIRDADAKKRIRSLQHELDALGRLRDPNANGCGSSGGGAAPGVPQAEPDRAGDAAETGGLLSAELSELLRRLWREADEVNIAYASCRSTQVPQ